MNLQKIIGIYIIGIILIPLYSKSITYSNSYYNKTQAIEIKNGGDKLKLTLSDEQLNVSTVNVQLKDFLFRKGKICNTKNLTNGFKKNVYLKYDWKMFELYCNFPSLCDDHVAITGIGWEKNNLKLDVSTFVNNDFMDKINLNFYFDETKLIRNLQRGYISILDYQSSNIDIRYELVNSVRGIYFSSYLALGLEEIKIFFEKQNFNYLYKLGFKLNTKNAHVTFNDYFYPQSNFSGKGATRKFEIDSTINETINRGLAFGFLIKSMQLRLNEKVENNEDLKFTRTQYYYLTLYFLMNQKYKVNIRCGIIKEEPIVELTINNFKIGYNYKGFYDSINLKFKNTNMSLNINYIFKKKLDISFGYSF